MSEYEELKGVAEAMHEKYSKAKMCIDCSYLLSMIERIDRLEKDAELLRFNPEHVYKAWLGMGIDLAGFSWPAFVFKVKDAQDAAMQSTKEST